MTSPTVTVMAVVSLVTLGLLSIFVLPSEALPVRPLTSDILDRETTSTDLVLLTLCWDGHTINPQCQRSKQGRALLRELLYNLLFKSRSGSNPDSDTEELEKNQPEVNMKLLRASSKGKRRDNNSQFYSDW